MRTAVYAGTFDPVTAGHLSVIRRVASLFDRVVVLVAVNPEKRPLFSEGERVELLRDAVTEWGNVEVESTHGYVAHYAQEVSARWLIRGVRGTSDVEAEHQLALLNQGIAPELTTLFIPTETALAEVSSSGLKALARAGASLERYCTPAVASALRERIREEQRHGV